MATAKEYLAGRTKSIGAAVKELAVRTWFTEFFNGLDTNSSLVPTNIWVVVAGIKFDLVFTPDGVRICHDYQQTGQWQGERKFDLLYVDFTDEGLVAELEKVFVRLVQKLTR